jgi:hypothetical protein
MNTDEDQAPVNLSIVNLSIVNYFNAARIVFSPPPP